MLQVGYIRMRGFSLDVNDNDSQLVTIGVSYDSLAMQQATTLNGDSHVIEHYTCLATHKALPYPSLLPLAVVLVE
jgi:hypothetical protein